MLWELVTKCGHSRSLITVYLSSWFSFSLLLVIHRIWIYSRQGACVHSKSKATGRPDILSESIVPHFVEVDDDDDRSVVRSSLHFVVQFKWLSFPLMSQQQPNRGTDDQSSERENMFRIEKLQSQWMGVDSITLSSFCWGWRRWSGCIQLQRGRNQTNSLLTERKVNYW